MFWRKPKNSAQITDLGPVYAGVIKSTLAISVGLREVDDKPNIIGSGFIAEREELIFT